LLADHPQREIAGFEVLLWTSGFRGRIATCLGNPLEDDKADPTPRMAINVMATFMPEFHTYAALPGSTRTSPDI
jgi:hypothetical protein